MSHFVVCFQFQFSYIIAFENAGYTLNPLYVLDYTEDCLLFKTPLSILYNKNGLCDIFHSTSVKNQNNDKYVQLGIIVSMNNMTCF